MTIIPAGEVAWGHSHGNSQETRKNVLFQGFPCGEFGVKMPIIRNNSISLGLPFDGAMVNGQWGIYGSLKPNFSPWRGLNRFRLPDGMIHPIVKSSVKYSCVFPSSSGSCSTGPVSCLRDHFAFSLVSFIQWWTVWFLRYQKQGQTRGTDIPETGYCRIDRLLSGIKTQQKLTIQFSFNWNSLNWQQNRLPGSNKQNGDHRRVWC